MKRRCAAIKITIAFVIKFANILGFIFMEKIRQKFSTFLYVFLVVDEKNSPESFARNKNVVPLQRQRRDQCSLGYGVMVTQQILVLFFLVRVRVAQRSRARDASPRGRSRHQTKFRLGYGVMATQQILVLFFLVRVRVAQRSKRWRAWFSTSCCVFTLEAAPWPHTFMNFTV